jgi:hypothetical protein
MNLLVLVLAALTVSPALSAPADYLGRHNNRQPPVHATANDPSDDRQRYLESVARVRVLEDYPPQNYPPSQGQSDHHPAADTQSETVHDDYIPQKVSFVAGTAAGALIGEIEYKLSKSNQKNQTKRTSEAFEGPANADLMERAPGDHHLDK